MVPGVQKNAFYDFQNFYEGELLFNRFKNDFKLSIFALGTNTPRSNFGYSDANSFGLTNESNFNNGRWWQDFASNNSSGIPRTFRSGFYYSDKISKKVKIHLINTGKNTMTGGRLKRLKKNLSTTFLMTYGDGLADVNLKKLVDFHKKNKKIFTLTAVRPPARFGVIKIRGKIVKFFREKSSLDTGWINGGFFVIQPKFIDLIKNDKTFLEKEPFLLATKKKQLLAFKHHGFWQCMDTLRDKEILEKKIKNKEYID